MSQEKENQAREWIEAVLKKKLPGPLGSTLRNGVILCELARAIQPGSVRKPYTGGTSNYKEMENITMFINYGRSLGVPDHLNMSTVALYEQKDIPQVIGCIHVFGSYVQKSVPNYRGPKLGATIATENSRTFTLDHKLASAGSSSRWTMGSQSSMDRSTGGACHPLHGYDNRASSGAAGGAPPEPAAGHSTWAMAPSDPGPSSAAGGRPGVNRASKPGAVTHSQSARWEPTSSTSARLFGGESKQPVDAAAAAASANTAMGWLHKQGRTVKNWKKRWFVLEDGILTYKTRRGGQVSE